MTSNNLLLLENILSIFNVFFPHGFCFCSLDPQQYYFDYKPKGIISNPWPHIYIYILPLGINHQIYSSSNSWYGTTNYLPSINWFPPITASQWQCWFSSSCLNWSVNKHACSLQLVVIPIEATGTGRVVAWTFRSAWENPFTRTE